MKREVFTWLASVGLREGDGVVLGVSGGPDSMALLHLFYRFGIEHTPVRLCIAHLHHGLRDTADRDADFVREQAERFGISYYPKYIDAKLEAKERGLSVEMLGRIRRYAHFSEIQEKTESRFVATGHHRSDQLESILLHIVRGSGIDGLIGMQREKDGLLRPLLPYDKEAILDYVREQRIDYRLDETNEQSHYLRNFLRLHVVPELTKANPRFDLALSTLSENASDAQEIIHEAVQAFFSLYRSGEKEFLIETKAYLSASPAMQRAIIRACVVELRGTSEGLTRAQTEEIVKVWSARTGASICMHGLEFVVTQSGLLAKKVTERVPEDLLVAEAGNSFAWGDFFFTLEPAGAYSLEDLRDPAQIFVPKELAIHAVLRGRRPDDFIQPFGMKGTKSIADSMKDIKLRVDLRASWPLLCVGSEVLWIPGYQKSEKTRVFSGDEWIRFQYQWEGMDARL